MQALLQSIQTYTPLQPSEITLLQEVVERRTLKRNEMLFSAGPVARDIYFLTQGCIRLFYLAKGQEKTAFFYTEGKFICAGESYTFQVPAKENYQALEDSEVYVFTPSAIEKMLSSSPTFEIMARIATEDELISSQRLIASFVTQTAEERYVALLEDRGDLFQRVPQQHIASYLGVSPETLSRIKARVHAKLHT